MVHPHLHSTRLFAVYCLVALICELPASHFAIGQDTGATDSGRLRLILPPTVYAVEGLESNIYFDNVFLTTRPDHYACDVNCVHGKHQTDRWTWTPATGERGSYPLTIEIRDEANEIIGSAATTVVVSPADSGANKKLSVLMVGDSLTHASLYPARVLELCKPAGNPAVSLIGSFEPAGAPPGVRHEGYGGWTAKRFATHFAEIAREGDYGKRGSPFLYGDAKKPQLDFKRYCQDINQGMLPKVVTIFLGPNDIYAATDKNLEASIDDMLTHLDQLIAMVHSTNKSTIVALLLPVPPAATQDAFGANYFSSQTRWQYKRNQHRLNERMLDKYAAREADAIHLVPTYVNLDCRHNYPTEVVPWNARTSAQGERQNNGVHPAAAGYEQIGDSLYAWLKHLSGL